MPEKFENMRSKETLENTKILDKIDIINEKNKSSDIKERFRAKKMDKHILQFVDLDRAAI